MAPSLVLSQVDLMNFRVEYVRPPSEREVLNKQDEGLFRKSTLCCVYRSTSHLFGQDDPYFESCDILRQHLLRNSWQT